MDIEIIQSPNDKRKYKHIQLKNNLQALLIQDVDADKSAASLDVYIGQLEDPEENQGIAHFCEHMLFMGTKKYPVQNEYSAFITKNSGSENAFTDLTDTNYYFDIANDAFEQGLDRFAQFFISPLFDETCVEKEINAVDSEHQLGLANDDCRNWQLFKNTAKQSSFKQNGGGNLKTLQKPSIRNDLLKFYEKYYSSNLMKLVLYSNSSIEQQEKWVIEKFSEIPNKNLERPKYTDVPFDASNLQKQINVVPIREEDTLELLWILPSLRNEYKKKTDDFISYLAGFEGKNSLTTFLIDEGLITDLMSYNEHILDFFTVFGIKMTLTQEGLENYDRVVGFIYKYFDIIKEKGIQEWQYKELKQIEQIQFQFLEKSPASDYATQLSQKMQYINIQDILAYKYQWEDYDPSQIQSILSKLTVDNMQLYLSSHQFEEDEDYTDYDSEEHYGTRFKVLDIPEDILDLCKNNSELQAENTHKMLDITVENQFIPQKFDLLSKSHLKNNKPEIIHQSEISELWYKQDEKFDIQKGWVSFVIHTNDLQLNDSVKGWVQAEMWLHLVEYFIQEMIDMADQTYMKCEIKLIPGGLRFKIKGYDNSLYKFIDSIIRGIFEFDVEKDAGERIFNIFFEKCETEYLNHFKDQPEYLAEEYLTDIIQVDGRYPEELKLETLRELKYEEFKDNIKKQWLKSFFIEWYFYGNLNGQDCVSFVKELEKIIKPDSTNNDFKPVSKQDIHPLRASILNINEILQFQYSLDDEEIGNQEEPNSAIQMTFQGEPETPEYRLKLRILKNYLSEPFFDQLRTNEQLGYSVFCFDQYVRGLCGLSFVIQSSVKNPNKLSERILAFLDQTKQTLQNIPQKEFDDLKTSVFVKETAKEDNMYKEANYYYQEIYFHAYIFDRKEQVKGIIDKITKQDIIDLYEQIFFKDNKRVEVHIVSKDHTEDQEKSFEERADKDKIIKIQSIVEYQQQQKDAGNIHRDYYGPQNIYNPQKQ